MITIVKHTSRKSGFSLVEVLAAVALIGIVTFLALPNIVAVKSQSEENLAIAQAEAMNIAIASFIQAHGKDEAETLWTQSGSTEATRYALLGAYLAYAPDDISSYMSGTEFHVALPTTLVNVGKVVLTKGTGADEVVIGY